MSVKFCQIFVNFKTDLYSIHAVEGMRESKNDNIPQMWKSS